MGKASRLKRQRNAQAEKVTDRGGITPIPINELKREIGRAHV